MTAPHCEECARLRAERDQAQSRLKRFADEALAGLSGVVCTPEETYLHAQHCFAGDLARLRSMWLAAAAENERITAERDAAVKAKEEAERALKGEEALHRATRELNGKASADLASLRAQLEQVRGALKQIEAGLAGEDEDFVAKIPDIVRAALSPPASGAETPKSGAITLDAIEAAARKIASMPPPAPCGTAENRHLTGRRCDGSGRQSCEKCGAPLDCLGCRNCKPASAAATDKSHG